MTFFLFGPMRSRNFKIFLIVCIDFVLILKFTYKDFIEQINFIDVIVGNEKGEFVRDLYCKATDCHQCLHYGSYYPNHMKNQVFIVRTQMKHLCSAKSREERWRPKGIYMKNVRISFVVNYHPHIKNISKIIKEHIKHLYANPEVRSVFTPLPFCLFSFSMKFRESFGDI